MLNDFNLIVTTTRGKEENACCEIWYLLGEIGDEAAAVDKTGVKGLIVAKSTIDPFEVIDRFREMLEDRPWEFMYSLRIIPIEQVVRTNLGEIQKATMKRSHRIREDEKFRVTVEKRFNETTTSEIVDAIATKIGRKVDLTNPNKIVLIEVVGGFTGVSVIDPIDILSVTREKNGVIQV